MVTIDMVITGIAILLIFPIMRTIAKRDRSDPRHWNNLE